MPSSDTISSKHESPLVSGVVSFIAIVWKGIRYILQRLTFQTPYYRLTLEGFLFLLVTLFIGFAAFNTDINLLYLILSVMCAFMVVSGMMSTLSLRPIKVERELPRHFVAGESSQVSLIVHNHKRLFNSYSLRLSDHLQEGKAVAHAFVLAVPRRGHVNVSCPVIFPRRGVYTLDKIKVSSRFPFGFFERSTFILSSAEVVVYPQTVDIESLNLSAENPFGERETSRKGQGTSLYGLREYTTSDSARAIHWKVSARTQDLIVREFESEQRRHFYIVLNNQTARNITPELEDRFEKAVVLCASVAKRLIESGFQVELITASGRVPADTGRSQLHRVFRALALLELTGVEETGASRLRRGEGGGPDVTSLHIAWESETHSGQTGSAITLGIEHLKDGEK